MRVITRRARSTHGEDDAYENALAGPDSGRDRALAIRGAHAQSAPVYFVEPKDDATVTSPVHVKFGVDSMKVAPAGTMTEGTGHHHLIVDGSPVPRAP